MLSKPDTLLHSFISADVNTLASRYAQLKREYDEADHDDIETCKGLNAAATACNSIGAFRFPNEWEAAKANAETLEIA